MTEAVRIITEQVRLRVRREGVDLSADSALVEQYVRDELRRYSERAGSRR
jgi:pilus assembly protein CpaF